VAVGEVVKPLSQGAHVSDEVACKAAEYFPGPHDAHKGELPLLNLPVGHCVHALAQATHGRWVEPILHVALELQLTQTLAPAEDPEPNGHVWHAVAP
jgi:hypothetical protein